jgi:DNA polymerase IV
MLRWLFLDMNAYFASVEQQTRPELRGRPVAVAPMDTDSTCCIAASYEAKPFGVRTGTPVGLARHLCPPLRVVVARPPVYVEFHKRIIDVVENHLHVDQVLSIDEMACRLPSNENSEERACAIARAIKQALVQTLGPCIRCSIGIAPNRFLAKVASDMQKPDGLVVLQMEDLPAKLLPLDIRDLVGIGQNMQIRLAACGADTVAALWAFSPDAMARAWGGIVGRQFWRNLHGEDVVAPPTRRRSVGHSNVLAPELRTDAGAYAVLVRLVHKAAARLRHLGYAAGQISIHVMYENHSTWGDHIGMDDVQDTQTLLEAMGYLWQRRPPGTPKMVGMVFFDLELATNVTLPLFGHDTRRLDLARAMDEINARYGRQTLYFAEMHMSRGTAPMRIAFNAIPDENW